MVYAYEAGEEFLVNTETAHVQADSMVTGLSNGGFVITWRDTSAVDHWFIKAQLFDASGAKVGGEFVVSPDGAVGPSEPTITSLTGGGFVAAWSDSQDVWAQIFDNSGAKVGAPIDVPDLDGIRPSITGLSSGGFVLSWNGWVGPPDPEGEFVNRGVAGQVYNAGGYASGSVFTADVANGSEVTWLYNHGFVVVYEDYLAGSGTDGIRAKFYDSFGNAGTQFIVSTNAAHNHHDPDIATLTNGAVVITWREQNGGSNGWDIKAKIIASYGVIVPEFLVSTQTANDQMNPTVTSLKDGGFIIAWDDQSGTLGDADVAGIKAQLFNKNGQKVGTEFLVNTTTTAGQWVPEVATLADGSFVISWLDFSGEGGDASETSVKAKLFQVYLTGPTEGDDILIGTPENDTIDGLGGHDSITGLGGDDSLISGEGYDTLDGGDGNDVLIMSNNGSGWLYGGAGNDTLYGSNLSSYLHGEAGDDVIHGGTATNQLNGDAGNDTLYGSDVNNGISGGTGDDVIYGYGGVDNIDGDDGNDSIDGGDGNDGIRASGGHDTVYGGAGNDELFGDDYLDVGNDWLDGGVGNDTMNGAMGNDTYVVRDAGDRVVEIENAGTDLVLAYADFQAQNFVENITGQGTANITLSGNALNNVITGNSGRNTIKGNDGNDTIDGGAGNDKIDGGNGDDRLWGGADSDQLTGGEGSDSLEGGNGSDQLNGGARWDTLRGGEGNDILDGGLDNDAMYGGTGNDTYMVDHVGDRVYENYGEGTDTVKSSISYVMTPDVEVLYLIEGAYSGTGNGLVNSMNGSSLNNLLSGLGGNDSLFGWDGNDSLIGGNDHDRLSGGNGDDTLTGGHGNDNLGGGAGADDFVFSSTAINGHDHVVDFVHGLDRLVFTGSDYGFASGHVLTASEFTVGAAAVGSSAQFVWDSVGRHLYFDADGDGADAAIELALISGASVVSADDLYFT